MHYERCLTEEFSITNIIYVIQPKQFILHDYQDQICLNVDLELSTTSRINIGYKEISINIILVKQIRSILFYFSYTELHDHITNIFINQFAMHIDVYQPTILESALHTRLCINTLNVRFNLIDIYFGIMHIFSFSRQDIIRLITSSTIFEIIGKNVKVI